MIHTLKDFQKDSRQKSLLCFIDYLFIFQTFFALAPVMIDCGIRNNFLAKSFDTVCIETRNIKGS